MFNFKYLPLLILISQINSRLVEWSPNVNSELFITKSDGKTPCIANKLKFPTDTMVWSLMVTNLTVGHEILLPSNGDIYFTDGSKITFGNDDSTKGCENDTYNIEPKKSLNWLKADVWKSKSFNGATPDYERIPCREDTVVFSMPAKSSQITVQLPNVDMNVNDLIINDRHYKTIDFWRAIWKQEYNFQTNGFVQIKPFQCLKRIGCKCQDIPYDIDCSEKVCKALKCSQPIKPEGHCCFICGGALVFSPYLKFEFESFRELVESYVNNQPVEYHLGLTEYSQIQLIITENGSYNGISSLLIHDISSFVNSEKYVLLSGSPKHSSWRSFDVPVIMFFTICSLFLGIYFWYYRRTPANNLNLNQSFHRFVNRENSLVGSMVSTEGASFSTSFRNPLYSSLKSTKSDINKTTEEETQVTNE